MWGRKENNISTIRRGQIHRAIQSKTSSGQWTRHWKVLEHSAEIGKHEAVFRRLFTGTIFSLLVAGFSIVPVQQVPIPENQWFPNFREQKYHLVGMWKSKSQNPTTTDFRSGRGICILKISTPLKNSKAVGFQPLSEKCNSIINPGALLGRHVWKHTVK